MIRLGLLFAALTAAGWAQDLTFPLMESFQARDATDSSYQQGLSNLDARQWDAAMGNFDAVAKHNKALADAALYWKAYALSHAGRLTDSLAVIKKLESFFPQSRWVRDANALSVEIQADAGHPVNPAAETDEDLKLLALNTLMQEDAKAGTPALIQVINGHASDKTKEHALFVLAQSDSAEARKALIRFAQQSEHPDVQATAVRMMGMMGGDGARTELAGLYTSSSNQALKREILNGLMLSGSKSVLLSVAKTEPDPGLRNSAIMNLSLTGGNAELSQLYKSGASVDEKKQILNSVFLTGDSKTLLNVVKQETDTGLRIAAIKSLGAMPNRGAVLTDLFRTETNDEVRQAVLNALVMQQSYVALAELARTEKDSRMKTEILRRLAMLPRRPAETPGPPR